MQGALRVLLRWDSHKFPKSQVRPNQHQLPLPPALHWFTSSGFTQGRHAQELGASISSQQPWFLWRKTHGRLVRGSYRTSPPCRRLHCLEGTAVSPTPWMMGPSQSPRVAVTPVQSVFVLLRKPIDCRKWLLCPSRSEVKHCCLQLWASLPTSLFFTHYPQCTGDEWMEDRTFRIWEGWSVWLWVLYLSPSFCKEPR